MVETKGQLTLNRRDVPWTKSIAAEGSRNEFRFGGLEVPLGLVGLSKIVGKSGRLTMPRQLYVQWCTGAGEFKVMLRHSNRSNYVDVAELDPDDAETLALAILEAVKSVREV